MITAAEFTFRMKQICEAQSGHEYLDPEINHMRADEFLCQVLRDLGYDEGVKIFEEMQKWYS